MTDDATGYTAAPARYTATEDGRETCDRMRDFLGDEGFAAACQANVIKYTDRAGRKVSKPEKRLDAVLKFIAAYMPESVRSVFYIIYPWAKEYTPSKAAHERYMQDMAKAWWWCQMFFHVRGETNDPRSGREGFVGYSRPMGMRWNCWNCRHNYIPEWSNMNRCHSDEYIDDWFDSIELDNMLMPPRDADGCPGCALKVTL